VEIIRPQAATTTYTFRVEFDITISNDYAPLHLGLSYEFSKAEDKRTSTAMCVQLSTKTAPNIPAPPIGAFLETFTQSTWENVAKAIPVLKEVANAIYVTRASLEVTRPVQGSASVSAFAISAGLSNLVLLDKPSLIVECGELDFAYFRNSWTARIKTSMLFGGKYKCSATLTLPTADEAGGFEFINNDESFTAGALVSALDLGLDLKDVPVIGSAIADVRFKYLSLSVHNVDGKLQLSGFTLQLGWDDHKIDDLVLSGSRLTIDWKRETFQSVKCISAPSSLPAFVNWSVQWEGMITDDWRLSASVQSFVPTQAVREGSEPTRQTILSGTIFNIHTSKPADSLTNLIGSSDGQPASIWNNTELCQHFKPHFTLERCMIHLSVGLETMYAVGARARWGLEASGSALLILKKVEQAGSKTWGFAFAVAVHQFRFAEFCSDSWLSQFFDGNLVSLICLCVRSHVLMDIYEGFERSLRNRLPQSRRVALPRC
jgi:hypothetical protein